MTSLEAVFHGPGFVAAHQSFIFGDEFVEAVAVTKEEIRPTRDDQFVHPQGSDWDESDRMLSEPGVMVFLGGTGTGRGTAALFRLRQRCRTDQLMKLEASWERPNARLLPPASPGFGYALDLSEYDKTPSSEFGMALRNWAKESSAYLIVLASETSINDAWLRSLSDRTVRLHSPDGKSLAANELRSSGAGDLVDRLNDESFAEIWAAAPRASEVLRLTRILLANPTADSAEIADEFLGWKSWFESDCPRDFGLRTLVWSAAMCDGGLRTSVLGMSEALRKQLQEPRTLVDIFSDNFASQRLQNANIHEDGDKVQLDPKCHGLAAAVRLHLWHQFAEHRDKLTTWAIGQAVELEIPDARRVVNSLMELAVYYRDHTLVQKLFDSLSTKRPKLLIEALSNAVLDPLFGAYIRGRLYSWLDRKPTQDVVDVVAAVCGGEFGRVKPSMAITRLGRAALRSPDPLSPALVNAFTSISASEHRQLLFRAIKRWLQTADTERAGVVAFLCIAGTKEGTAALYGEPGNEISTEALIQAFQKAIAREETYKPAITVMQAWEEAATHGVLNRDRITELFGAVIRPHIRRNIIFDLSSGDRRGELVDDILKYAIQQSGTPTESVKKERSDDAVVG
ncbi:hypothetical protein [Planomonospora parontospora]|uniref:hypothetical protein n=1 Tax=Planomonospora parontospora TaxID=58119 RepID=UPI001671470D|nr:hypothetical protein [Planomonospora parontospora]GGL50636.1 hypothetical protein GCM10014719_59950 [Planomonospora parontospora subsp. antibiotica]GII19013.1 hypothetical protein Ppa05_57390 [Planomonospora parontospora subsp. antibiotica]